MGASNQKKKQANSLKKAMRQLPFPVAIATAAVGKEKRGITIGSFTSLSLDPPLISFNIDREAQIYPLITRATHFSVHLPQPEQAKLCDHFSISGLSSDEQFESINYQRNSYGTPVLKEIPTVIQCRAYDQISAGDHIIIIGEVAEVEQENENPSILYYDRSYREIGAIAPKEEPNIKRVG